MNIKDTASNFFTFPLVDSNVKVYLIVDQREYEVEQFKIGFTQSTDHKGEPQAETKGGQLLIGLTQTVPESMYDWILKPARRKDGEVVFKNQTSSSPLKIEFFNAACINFTREINLAGGLQTNLILSPERLIMNDVEHDNFWVG
jgi:hypothetical protein